jgi:hypothetical protein
MIPFKYSMKNLIFFLILITGSNLFGQTDSIEKAVLYNKVISKELDVEEFSKTCKQWNIKIKSDKYPEQPMDQNGQVHYNFIYEIKGFDKEYLFNRTLEWLLINYSFLPSNVYSNLKDGKIIYNISLSLFDKYSCISTAVVSIKDAKIRVEFINISYQAYFAGDYANGIPERTENLKVYPIILKKYNDWDLNFSLLRESTRVFNKEVQSLTDYIKSYEHINIF